MANRAKFYKSPLSIPEGSVGSHSIRHLPYKAGAKFHTANIRSQIMGGQERHELVFTKPGHWHELGHVGGVWMTDMPDEQAQCNRAITRMRGDVLVGGLGLGYAAVRLAEMPFVRSITVVEKSHEVIELVEKHLPAAARKKLRVIHADLFDVLEIAGAASAMKGGSVYDHAFYDIWQSDGERTLFGTVIPLLQMSRGIVAARPVCWNEDVMRGQLQAGLIGNAMRVDSIPDKALAFTGDVWMDWRVPFLRWLKEQPRSQEEWEREAGRYANTFGVEPLPPELAKVYGKHRKL